MNFWTQNYSVVGNSITLTALVALIPIVFFLLALTVFKLKGHIASGLTLVLAAIIAIFVYGMPASSAASAGLFGILIGLWPIGWIVIWAIFIYNISVTTGKFEVIRAFISGVTKDQRIQVLLIAFAFGVFLEGVAGFGIPIAIGAGLLLGVGMRSPILAASVCLVSNMASAPTGAIGIPVIVLARITGVDLHEISALVSRQLIIVIFILPFWLTAMVDGFRGIKDILPMILVTAIVSVITTYVVYNYIGPELSDVILGIVAMAAIIAFSAVWKPKNLLTENGYETAAEVQASAKVANQESGAKHFTIGQTLFAWSPYFVLTVLALLWTQPAIKQTLDAFTLHFQMPQLHHFVVKGAPLAVANQAPESAIWNLDLLKAVGTALFFSAVYTVVAFRVKPAVALKVLGSTFKQLIFPILTICFVLGFAKVADFSGQIASIALLLANTGHAFPAFAPLLGTLGVFLTGSVVNSNTLFGKVQLITGQQIGVNPHLLVASNTLGSIAGKVISPQSIAIACAATNNSGNEGQLLSAVLKHALIFALFICLMTYAQAFWIPGTAIIS